MKLYVQFLFKNNEWFGTVTKTVPGLDTFCLLWPVANKSKVKVYIGAVDQYSDMIRIKKLGQ
jgi:hypothetical protein